ncbi:MAG: hypothetical protein RI894_1947 [Bacteroidota bacterium]|jgi:methionyl-tRNA formyltransferase
MGTPDFAVPALEAILLTEHEVVGVVTATDKMGGRGNKQLIESDVKKCAMKHGLRILQPEKFRNEAFLSELRAINADLQVVVAFRMLPEVVWAMPRLGTINVHGSLLPKYRGAAPINWAIMNGERETGVTTFFLRHEIDTGNMILQGKTSIDENETFGQLYDRMKHIGAAVLVETLQKIATGDLNGKPQDERLACPAPKLFLENTQLDVTKTVAEVHRFVRGLSPHPAAWTTLNGLQLKVFDAKQEIDTPTSPIGTFVSDHKKYLKIALSDGYLHLLDVQLAGKKRMDIQAFLNGYKDLEAEI